MPAVLSEPSVFGAIEQSVLDRLEPDRSSDSETEFSEMANAHLDRLIEDIHALTPFWKKVSESALRSGAEELHNIRDKVELVWRLKASLLDDIERIGERVLRATGQEPRAWSNLERAKGVVKEFELGVLNRWQTLDDLEDLLLAPVQLSDGTLKALAKKFPPPQSWYGEIWEDSP